MLRIKLMNACFDVLHSLWWVVSHAWNIDGYIGSLAGRVTLR